MRTSDKIFILLFCIIAAPILAVGATAIDSTVYNTQALAGSLKQSLNWFSQNPSISLAIIAICYVTAAILVIIAVITLLSIAADKRSTDDHNFIKDVSQSRRK